MNGNIQVKSSIVGKGTCMHFFIPLIEAPENFKLEKEKDLIMQSLKDKTVLLIDTQAPRRIKLLDELVKLQMKVHACSSDTEALAYVTHHIVFDVCIRERLNTSSRLDTELKQTPTLYIGEDIPDQHLFIEKISSNLLGVLRERPTHNSTPLDILVVEDNPYNLFVIVEMLRKLSYDEKCIDTAKTGTEAIQKSVTKVYDVILMDLLLPSIDGIAATQQILNYYKNKCPKHLRPSIDKYDSLIPTVLALTAMITDETKIKCKQAGMKGFLSKPICKEELDTMLSIVSKRRLQSRKLLLTV
jgi:CheY-like chemotaxis protein